MIYEREGDGDWGGGLVVGSSLLMVDVRVVDGSAGD